MGAGVKTWLERKDYFLLLLVFITLPLFSHAGGLGIAASVGVCGIASFVGFNFPLNSSVLHRIPAPIWAVLALLFWGIMSSFWSPYHTQDTLSNAVKILLGVPAYLACACLVKTYAGQDKKAKILLTILFVGAIGSALLILVDQLSGFAISLAVDPVNEGQDPNIRLGDMIQNVGHGTSVLSLLLAPVSVLLVLRGRRGKIAASSLVVLVLACGLTTGQSASTLGALAALLFMGLAFIRPVFVVCSGFFMAGCAVLFAPCLALFAARLSPEAKANLPFSWEERVENWGYLFDKIAQHPIKGHGFDAVRTFTETHTIRGFDERLLVSLHPHNAGLHIWVELGLIGALLVCLALYLGAKYLTEPGRLSKPQLVACSGFVISAAVMSSLSYGVWQDWWWASIIFIGAQIAFIKRSVHSP